VIGGPTKIGGTSTTISIGGLAQYPLDLNQILAVTYRFTLRGNNSSDPNNKRLHGETNYKLMGLWLSLDGGSNFARLSGHHQWADAVTMSFSLHDSNKIFMPTSGNGIWIGAFPYEKAAAQVEFVETNDHLPKKFDLHHNYPNPFNPNTVIKFDLPKATHVKLVIYDVMGRRVRLLADEQMQAGYHHRIWDGFDDRGSPVASGIYFYRLHTAEFTKARKMALLR
jgi:hypothetical protein